VSDDRNKLFEQRCLVAGDLVAGAVPGPAEASGPMPPDLVAALEGTPPRQRRWRWPAAAGLFASAAAAGLLVWSSLRERPLAFAVDGAVAEADGFFEAPRHTTARARFSDGTVVSVQPGGAAQVKGCTHDGATVSLARGSASFAVQHRPHASWHVEVGRFDIAVTGTEFEVRNADPAEGFELRMKSGAVIVHGPLAGNGIPLYAGQRLVASLAHRTLYVGEVGAVPAPAPAPSVERAVPVKTVETREEPPQRRSRAHARPITVATAEPEPALETPPEPTTMQPPHFEAPPEMPIAPAPPSTPQPPSVVPAVPAPAPMVGVGGSLCNEGSGPQISFDRPGEVASVMAGPHSAMTNPALDGSHSWCGGHSLRFDLDFNHAQPTDEPFRDGNRPFQSGEAIVKLPHPVDLRGRTVVVHFYVDAPGDVTFNARVLADDVGRRAGNTYAPGLTPGKWWAVSTTFHGPTGIFEPHANTAGASHVDGLVLRIDAAGDRRTWSGTIYIDDVSWR
jgi:FecR protein